MSDSHINEVPEFKNHSTEARRREVAAAGASPQQNLDKIRQKLKAPNLTAIETQIEPLASVPGCIEQFRVTGLQVGPNQRMKKKIFEQWFDGENCIRANYTVDFQFTGYGAYCLSFEKDATNSGLFDKFFRDIAGSGVNFHRTIIFVNENLENQTPGAVFNLLDGTVGKSATVNATYLANLVKLVTAARTYGIVVEVCLFMHHSVAHDHATTPLPVVLSGSPHDCYKLFYNVNGEYKTMQKSFIHDVVTKLTSFWNVVYEVGNELRVPQPTADYGEPQLKAWIDWAAGEIRANDPTHLITTSTGSENEADINTLSRIQFCQFHQGQWLSNLNAAVNRGKNNYGQKHIIIDDDGGNRPLTLVQTNSKAALDAGEYTINGQVVKGCCASFNHKGASPVNKYTLDWRTKLISDGVTPQQALDALKAARMNSISACKWE
jgi:hypothetical protein